MLILKIIYYLGLASCGMQGIQKSYKKTHSNTLIQHLRNYISSFLSAFGGGVIRDGLMLRTHPAVFTKDALQDLLITLGSALFYSKILYKKRCIELLIILTDAIGLAQFITIGVDRALLFKENYAFAVLCGVITSLGGGILSSVFTGESIKKIIQSNFIYRLIDIVGAIIYVILLIKDIDQTISQVVVVFYTLFLIIICNNLIHELLKRVFIKTVCITLKSNTYTNWDYLNFKFKSYICSKQFYCNLPNLPVLLMRFPIICRQRTFLYHRIRQM